MQCQWLHIAARFGHIEHYQAHKMLCFAVDTPTRKIFLRGSKPQPVVVFAETSDPNILGLNLSTPADFMLSLIAC